MLINHNILYLSHGGGPLPLLGEPTHQDLVAMWQNIAKQLPKPSAILVISAHWEAKLPTITSGVNPKLIYDYYGFPAESYSIEYSCPGSPELASRVQAALTQAGIASDLDEQRGFDHGLFVPLKIMFPQNDIPCIQLSLDESLSAPQHLAIGKALQALEWDNLLILGSGFSFHNMRAFGQAELDPGNTKNKAFDDWLTQTMCATELSEEQRYHRLSHWLDAPFARFCHPREEHLIPLHVCYGLSQAPAKNVWHCKVLRKQASMFGW